MQEVVVAVLIVIALIVAWKFGPYKPTEHADLAAPNFAGSLVDKYRDEIKDNRGMTLNDYALESAITHRTPLSGNYRVL
jgi:hypothetical protein